VNVGVYIDGYNLYYGARTNCGRSTAGWRWIDLRALADRIISAQSAWAGSVVSKIVYCTARVDAVTNPSGHADQDVYLKALLATGSVDWIEYGNYVARVKKGLLATEAPTTKRPILVSSKWPVQVKDANNQDVPGANFMISYLHVEEKGSDVNVAAHLLTDVLSGAVDAAVVISNDSDLRLPVKLVRDRVPLGMVNPRNGYFAGDLAGKATDGVGNHWWRKLNAADYTACQLPDPATGFTKPAGW
jgi:uncharacterized LabA/DUF88 family protein